MENIDLLIGWTRPDLTKSYHDQGPWVQLCEKCHGRVATDGHHAIIKRSKGKNKLDLPHNICWLCHKCHMQDGTVNGREFAEWFWKQQCRRFGEDEMRRWIDSLPIKIKPYFGEVRK